jgi:hypothetical protein
MNSFSPNKAVSNSKTVVRFAVYFFGAILTSLALIVQLPIALGNQTLPLDSAASASAACAQAAAEKDPNLKATLQKICDLAMKKLEAEGNPTKPLSRDEELLKLCRDKDPEAQVLCRLRKAELNAGAASHKTRNCENLDKEIREISQKASKACAAANLGGNNFSKCLDQIAWCQKAEADIGDMIAEEEMSEDQLCDTALANSCQGLPRFMEGRNFREEEKEAEKERVSAKRSVDELTKERREAQRDRLKQQRELQEAQQDAAHEVRKAEREIAKDMSNQFKDVQSGQKKAFEDAQRAYQEMDATYIKMRDESRQYALKVEDAKDKFHGQCIAQAESQFKAAEQARLAAKSKKKKNAGSATRLAGSSNRQKLNQTALRNFDYNAFLNECLNGQTGVGKSLANGVRAVEREKAARDQSLKEQSALIEQQRQTMLKKLMELEGVADSQNAEIVKQTNERLQNLSEEQKRIAAKNSARLTEFMQDQQLRINDIDQRLQTESQQLSKYEREALVANRRATCAGSAARKSEARVEKIGEGFADAISEISGLYGLCEQFERRCPVEKGPTSGGAPAARVSAPGSGDTEDENSVRYALPPSCALAKSAITGSEQRLKKRGSWNPDRTERTRR